MATRGGIKTSGSFAVVYALVLVTSAGAQQAKATPTRSSFVPSADGAKIHYVEAGKGSAILFVPGWTAPGWMWEKQIAHFAKTHRVVAIDPQSQGESSQAAEGLYTAARGCRALPRRVFRGPPGMTGGVPAMAGASI